MSTVTENIKEGASNAAQAVADKTNQVSEKMQEKKADAKYEVHKNQAQDPDQPLENRVKAGLNAAGDKIEGTKHEAKGEYYKNKPNDAGEKIEEAKHEAKEELNKKSAEVNSTVVALKEGAINTLDLVGEKLQGTAEYLKVYVEGENRNPQGGVVQTIKDVSVATLAFVGETTQQTAGYLRGEPAAVEQVEKKAEEAKEKVLDGVNAVGEKVIEVKEELTKKTAEVGTVAVIKDVSLNTLDFIGEKLQGTAEYLKGEESAGNAQGGVVQTIKDVSVATLQFVGETTHQTVEYLRGDPSAVEQVEKKAEEVKDKVEDAAKDVKEGAQEAAKDAADKTNEVAERMMAKKADAQFEAHKAQAQDASQPVSVRAAAVINCVGDALEGYQHRNNEQFYKNK